MWLWWGPLLSVPLWWGPLLLSVPLWWGPLHALLCVLLAHSCDRMTSRRSDRTLCLFPGCLRIMPSRLVPILAGSIDSGWPFVLPVAFRLLPFNGMSSICCSGYLRICHRLDVDYVPTHGTDLLNRLSPDAATLWH
jgi:hypothetical protein